MKISNSDLQEVDHRESAPAVWKQIAEEFQQQLADGVFEPGERIPSDRELAGKFGVNRHTVRRALADLTHRGLLSVEHGRGTFVSRNALNFVMGKRMRFSANLLAQGFEPSRRLISSGLISAPESIASELDLPIFSPVAYIEVVGEASGIPISFGKNYFPAQRFPGFPEIFAKLQGISETFAHFGVGDYIRKYTRLIARMPSPEEAKILDIGTNSPLISTTSLNVDMDGQPIQYAEGNMAADRVQILIPNDQLVSDTLGASDCEEKDSKL